MAVRVGINGFGRMGRLALRAAWSQDVEFIHINDSSGDAASAAHLLEFDSIHGRWDRSVTAGADGKSLVIDGKRIGWSRNKAIDDTPWAELQLDAVVECTGKFRTVEALSPYFRTGAAVRRVIVSAPVKSPEVLNVVMGVNDDLYDPQVHRIVTAASCTTNCIAPVVDVMLREFAVRHCSITTIHDLTNTQNVLDGFHKDLRRARAAGLSLIPTTTGSATAITEIFPQLQGRIDGIAVRVPLANASLTDCVFELETPVTVEQVNTAMQQAASGRLRGILGFEDRPLVSVDFTNDTRSGIVDALSTRVVNGTQVKLLVWYDNEVAYVHRMMELVRKVVAAG